MNLVLPQATLADDAPFADFDSYVEKMMKQSDTPAMAVAVVKDDKLVYAKGFGVCKLGEDKKCDEHTIFAIGSCSKAVTAAIIGMLVDEKKMQWDGHLTEYLKGFQLFDPYVTREVTIRDALCHRTGLPEMEMLWYASPLAPKEILERMRYQKPASSFRSKWQYNNGMYLAAGESAAAVSGKSWQELVKERIFVPLHMSESNTSITQLTGLTNVAMPHSKINNVVKSVPYRSIDPCAPAGAINSNVGDMSQWIRLLLSNGKFEGKQLISAESLKETHTPQMVTHVPGKFAQKYPEIAQGASYGLGWACNNYHGHEIAWHGGGIDGMRSYVCIVPDMHLGMVFLTNSDACGHSLSAGLSFRIIDSYMKQPLQDWCQRMLDAYNADQAEGKKKEAELAAKRVPNTHPSLAVEKYAGKYSDTEYGDINIAKKDGKLRIDYGPERQGTLEHWNYDTYQIVWDDPMIDKCLAGFQLNQNGEAALVEISDLAIFNRKK
jgi:CubicO group peptidase (beta-lactamase class C family)